MWNPLNQKYTLPGGFPSWTSYRNAGTVTDVDEMVVMKCNCVGTVEQLWAVFRVDDLSPANKPIVTRGGVNLSLELNISRSS